LKLKLVEVEKIKVKKKDLKKDVGKINLFEDEDIRKKIEDLKFIIFTKSSWRKVQFFGHLDNKTLEATKSHKEESSSVLEEQLLGCHGDEYLMKKSKFFENNFL